jgi:hypothetical protein
LNKKWGYFHRILNILSIDALNDPCENYQWLLPYQSLGLHYQTFRLKICVIVTTMQYLPSIILLAGLELVTRNQWLNLLSKV